MAAETSSAYRRCLAWERLREQTLNRVRAERNAIQEAECTFTPKISSNERSAQAVETRLVLRAAQRDAEVQAMKRISEEVANAECTFTPRVEPHPLHAAMNAQQLRHFSTSIPRPVKDATPPLDPDCTFTPQIGPKSSRIYKTARLEEAGVDVFSRLYNRSIARRYRGAGENGTSNREAHSLPQSLETELHRLRSRFHVQFTETDMDTFLQSVCADDEEKVDYFDQFGAITEPSFVDQSPIPNLKEDDSAPVELMKFSDFLQRQAEMERKRQARQQELVSQNTPNHKPSLCSESLRLADEKGRESISASSRRKSEQERRQQLTDPKQGLQEFFKPAITQMAAASQGRDPAEMWKDYNRRQQLIDEMRKVAETKQSADLTFKPETNSNYGSITSILANNLQGYSAHLQQKRQKQQEAAQQEKRKREEAEEMGCTFRPQTNKVPKYVHRMSQSMVVLREVSEA